MNGSAVVPPSSHPAGLDATTVLTVYIWLLLAIPSPMVVSALGSAGAPSSIWAVGMFGLWLWFQVHRDREPFSRPRPVRAAVLWWLLTMLAVYAYAMAVPIPGDEVSPADNGMLKLVGLAGILLLANDGIVSVERHRAVVRRLVIGAGIVAALGVVQYATKQVIIDRISIPGLAAGTADLALAERSGLARPSGTSTHPIEYGIVLTMILPLVIAFAMRARSHRWAYKCALGVVGFAIFLSISRSAVVCATVAIAVLALKWTARTRMKALAALLALSVVVYLTVPGVLGTIARLFTGVREDPSIASRTGSYDLAWQFFSQSPLLGRGFGTFLPKYWILDNGYLGLLLEAGILGLVGLGAVIITALSAARRAHARSVDDLDAAVSQALVAAVAAGAAGLAFFDTFAFPQSAGTLFLILGLAGAMRRLTDQPVALDPGARDAPSPGATRQPGAGAPAVAVETEGAGRRDG